MFARDPIHILEGIADAAIDPDPAFGERLLDDLLSSLAPDSMSSTPGPVIAVTEAESLPVLDLISRTNKGADHMKPKTAIAGVFAAAAAIALIVGVLVSTDGDDDLQTVPAATTEATAPTTAAPAKTVPTTTTAPAFGATEGLVASDAYFAANSARDFGALRELFTSDANFTGSSIASNENAFAWNRGQGTTYTQPDCEAISEQAAEWVTVRCNFFIRDALVQAVDGPQVPAIAVLTVTPAGISFENVSFGQLDFYAVNQPFSRWMMANHPEDVDNVDFLEWDSVEVGQAEAYGALRAQYATEWAAYLELNGCDYDDGC